jgi:signal peptidase I
VFVALAVVLSVEVVVLTRLMFVSSIVTSNSMNPTLQRGDWVLVRRRRFTPANPPRRGAIVMFRDPRGNGDRLIKRVIGLPNEVITIAWGQVYINGALLTEPYLQTVTPGYWHGVVPDDAVFVMGDNRGVSEDSRTYGPVPLDLIEGEVVLRYYPLSRFGRLP